MRKGKLSLSQLFIAILFAVVGYQASLFLFFSKMDPSQTAPPPPPPLENPNPDKPTTTTNQTPRPKYPNGVPRKFDPDGNVQPFPGNTIVSHLASSTPLYRSLLGLYAKLEASPLAGLYTLLPPPSWHMTVFEGACDQVRKPGYWPADLRADAPLAACDALFARKLAAFDLRCPPPYRLSVHGFNPLRTGIGVRLEPVDGAESARLRGLRDRLAEELELRHRGHETYGLHLSVAYFLRHLTEEQEKELMGLLMGHLRQMEKELGVPDGGVIEFELGAPEFCRFDDMFEFKRQFYLKDQEKEGGVSE